MSTTKKQRHPVVVWAGCGCRVSRIFSSSSISKERPTSLRHHLSQSSPSHGHHSDDFFPSASSSDNIPPGNTSSGGSSVTNHDQSETANFTDLLCQLSDLEQSLVSSTSMRRQMATTVSSPLPPHPAVGGGGRRRRRRRRNLDESVAVEKSSADPLVDFRRSMLQMIVEKQIVDADDLRDLLHCFLSLNSPHHHQIILQAFFDVWNYAFASSSSVL